MPWGDPVKIYLVTVDKYKFYFNSLDESHEERVQLDKSIANIINEQRNTSENPDFEESKY